MKVELFPFQKMALFQLRRKTAEALGSYQRTHTPQVLSFTAPTGAGKTIILASLIESIYFGDEEYPDQPDAPSLCGFRILRSSTSSPAVRLT